MLLLEVRGIFRRSRRKLLHRPLAYSRRFRFRYLLLAADTMTTTRTTVRGLQHGP